MKRSSPNPGNDPDTEPGGSPPPPRLTAAVRGEEGGDRAAPPGASGQHRGFAPSFPTASEAPTGPKGSKTAPSGGKILRGEHLRAPRAPAVASPQPSPSFPPFVPVPQARSEPELKAPESPREWRRKRSEPHRVRRRWLPGTCLRVRRLRGEGKGGKGSSPSRA